MSRNQPHQIIRGEIAYTSDKPDRKGQERGREQYSIAKHADGRRTLMALCEIDDAPPVLRHVVMSVDGDFNPLDAFVRLTVGDKFTGSGWFKFFDDLAECETFTAAEGRVAQQMRLRRPLDGFGTHPIQGDAFLFNAYDRSQGPGKQRIDNFMVSSPDHRGATGPLLFALGFSIIFVGEERITVPAGEFDALHFQLTDTAGELPEEHPPYDCWLSNDGDYLMLRCVVGGYMATRYELTSLERTG